MEIHILIKSELKKKNNPKNNEESEKPQQKNHCVIKSKSRFAIARIEQTS